MVISLIYLERRPRASTSCTQTPDQGLFIWLKTNFSNGTLHKVRWEDQQKIFRRKAQSVSRPLWVIQAGDRDTLNLSTKVIEGIRHTVRYGKVRGYGSVP